MKKLSIILLFLILPAIALAASCDGTALSGLTEDTAPTADDIFYSVNDPSGTPGDRKVTLDSILRPTIQATDPTSSDDSGLYVNSVDGDAFLVSKNIGISTWATIYTPAATPVTFSSAEMTTGTQFKVTLSDTVTVTTAGTWTITGSTTGPDTATYDSILGSVLTFNTDNDTFVTGETLTLAHPGDGNTTPAITGFTGESVTNSISSGLISDVNAVGVYYFENDGTDETANNNTLTNNNLATFATSTPSPQQGTYSTDTNASSSFWSSASTDFDITGSMSVGGWFYSVGTSTRVLAGKHTGTDYGWTITKGSTDNLIEFRISSTGSDWNGGETTTATIPITTWTHITAVYDGSYMRLYVNGSEINDSTFPYAYSSGINNSTADLYIGGNATGSNYWGGNIDEAFIFNRALTAGEISGIYSGGF